MNYLDIDFWKRKFFGGDGLLKAMMSRQDLSATEKKILTKEMLEVLTLELSTYCNRKCDYCPVAFSDFRQDRRAQKQMDRALFARIRHDLAEIDYDRRLIFTGYNEPLYEPFLPEAIWQMRQILPRAHLMVFSNGDVLNHEKLLALVQAGLNEMVITLHPAPNQILTTRELERRLKQLLKRIQFAFSDDDFAAWQSKGCCEIYPFGVKIKIIWPNWRVEGTWRGGNLGIDMPPNARRTQPCLLPFREFMIYFDGTTLNCCHGFHDGSLGHDNPNIVSRVSEQVSLFDAFCSDKMKRFRRSIFNYGEKKGICEFCNYVDVADGNDREKRENILAELAKEDAKDAMIFVEPNRTEPNRTEPNRTEPNRTEPNRTEPNRTEPNQNKIVRREMNFPADIFFAKAFFRQSANIWRKKNPADKNAFLLLHF